MLILAIDSASDHLKVGLASADKVLGSFDGPPDRSHSEKIIAAIDRLLDDTKIDSAQVDALAVATGPGSFTGLRIGIATVLGLAQAWGKPVYGATNSILAKLYFDSLGKSPIVLFHCRADQFYVTDGTNPTYVDSWKRIESNLNGRSLAGTGTEKLLASGVSAGKLKLEDPLTYSAGELAQLFASQHSEFDLLDPVNLDVNYFLKSQPEQRIEEKRKELTVGDMMPADLEEIARIERESFSDAWTEENFRTDLSNSQAITLSARIGSSCIGYVVCFAADEYGYIANIAVDSAHRSRGIGLRLLKLLEERLQKLDIRQIVLDVRQSNIGAIRFYKEHGFTILTRREGFYSNPPEDSFTMLKVYEEK